MFKLILSSVFSLVIFSAVLAQSIVFIDMQQVVSQSQAGKEIQGKLNKEVEKLKKEIESKQAKGEKQEKLQKLIIEKQKELNRMRQEMAGKFMKILEKAVKEFSQKNGYDLVLDKNPIIYGSSKLNKTKEFLNFFNNYYKKHKNDK